MASTEGNEGKTRRASLGSSGIGQLTSILAEHLQRMKLKNELVDKIIAESASLQDAKKRSLDDETTLLLSIMDDIGEMNTFLNNIVLIENLFNQCYTDALKKQQEDARAKYAPNIGKYEHASKCQSEADSFVELVFAGQTHLVSFQTWLDKIKKQCDIQKVQFVSSSGAQTKKIARAFYKAFYVYDGADGFKRMTDILRCSFVFSDFASLYRCFAIIELMAEQTVKATNAPHGGILRVKDRFHPSTMPFGYRDLLVNMYCPESKVVVEIQLHFEGLYKYKKISHAMYKKARLFERDDGNLAYMYATKFMRPKIGNFKVYEPSAEEMTGVDADEDEEEKGVDAPDAAEPPKASEKSYTTLLKEWGLQKYVTKFEEDGWDDPHGWNDLDDDTLLEMGLPKGHVNKFTRMRTKWLEEVQQEEESADVAIFQDVVYGNQQPKLQALRQASNDHRRSTGINVRLVSANFPSHWVRHRNFALFIDDSTHDKSDLFMKDSTFTMVRPSLDGSGAPFVSFQSVNYPDHFVRHQNFRLYIHRREGSQLYIKDASFKVVPALNGRNGYISLQSKNYPGHYVRHQNYALYIHQRETADLYVNDASFKMEAVNPNDAQKLKTMM
mmetsp:Transcript_55438/g.92146  ORF Transcript_55438/g.92146 Transcript_55438/m.92146 type:complete len:612 (+) Transcript_55438:30-1865(+)|eukprot:CAMPEP_0202704504 /NCGR_PEP_ID=MMETSP1385-20130828/17169_1 /ASSEMBLY_ACC=CAM_ASM_000861 /TAXON_ID=933848 /ORGANISM="Elphidium margaritaceum" /LENGTH=611 /DNA_ID=CAMNT_0049362549 /DNA_START=21 /DNA_END=1856 /DNA_ORIENTATION=-